MSGKLVGPVAARERVAILDVLRGFAFFGVLTVNIESAFGTGWFRPDPGTNALDAGANWLIRFFIATKSITLLTFLFGLGFATQLVRAEARGEDARGAYVRRLLVLLGIGAVHLSLWWGDVTSHYAVIGLALLAFRRCSPRTLIAVAIALIAVPQVVMAIPGVTAAVRGALGHPANPEAIRDGVVAALRGSDYGAIVAAHFQQLGNYLALVVGWYPAWVLGRFLLGYYAGVTRLFDDDGAAQVDRCRRSLPWIVGVAAVSSALVWLTRSGALAPDALGPARWLIAVVANEVSVLSITAAYVMIAVILMQRPRARRALLIFVPVGRMPLTVYLSQTVIAMAIYYGWGLGLQGRIGAAGNLAIATAIFAAQTLACRAWLRRYRSGPVEWVWRSLAYGRRQPMRYAEPR